MFPKFRVPSPAPRPVESRRGTAWSITDETLALIDEHIAAHRPERGGALITVRDGRIVVDFIIDPRPGEQANYWHSDQLRDALREYLSTHPKRRYAGTLHSHPGTYAEPSGPDQEAFATTLRDNPSIREPLFPIVVQARRDDLGSVLRHGDEHLVDLPMGTLAGYCAEPDGESARVRPAPMHVLPVRADSAALAERLTSWVVQVSAGPTTELEIEGRYLPAIPFSVNGVHSFLLGFSETYPSQAPFLIGAGGLVCPHWQVGVDSVDQLVAAVTHLIPEVRPTVQDLEPVVASVDEVFDCAGDSTVDEEPTDTSALEDRLHLHLPGGIDAHYLVIGAGSVGSHAADMLVRSGVKHLSVVDFDTVEAANLSRTVYRRNHLGLLKVDALAEHLDEIAPDLQLRRYPSSIDEIDLAMLDDVDVVLLASDDLAAEFWFGHELYHRGIPSVSVKMFERADAGEIVVISPRHHTACLRCLIGEVGSNRGETDYGTGRLVAAPALGSDIIATVARGVRVALALGQVDGPLADWLEPHLRSGRTYFQQASVPDWPQIATFKPGQTSRAFDSLWALGQPADDCPVCGSHPEPPASRIGAFEMPTMLPPGVTLEQAGL